MLEENRRFHRTFFVTPTPKVLSFPLELILKVDFGYL